MISLQFIRNPIPDIKYSYQKNHKYYILRYLIHTEGG